MTIKQITIGLLLGLLGAPLACAQKGDDTKNNVASAPKMTRDLLLVHEFKESSDSRPEMGIFERKQARFGDVLKDLGLSVSSFRPTVNQPATSDVRSADLPEGWVVVTSEVRDKQGQVLRNSLDNLDAMCTVTVTLDQTPKRGYLKTNSTPRIQIKSVVPDKKANRLQVTFEVSAIGSKPLAISQRWFNSIIVGRDASSDRTFSADFPKGTPEFISILPDKPAVLSAIVRIDPTSDGQFYLSPGDHALRVQVGGHKPDRARIDYEWQGMAVFSDDYNFHY